MLGRWWCAAGLGDWSRLAHGQEAVRNQWAQHAGCEQKRDLRDRESCFFWWTLDGPVLSSGGPVGPVGEGWAPVKPRQLLSPHTQAPGAEAWPSGVRAGKPVLRFELASGCEVRTAGPGPEPGDEGEEKQKGFGPTGELKLVPAGANAELQGAPAEDAVFCHPDSSRSSMGKKGRDTKEKWGIGTIWN